MREIADELLETQRVEYHDEGGLIFVPPAGFTHMSIVGALNRCFYRAPAPEGRTSTSTSSWDLGSENFQWEFGDGTKHFFIPDLAVALPGSTTRAEFRENIVLLVEVTSPKATETVEADRSAKPKRCAKAGVPFYLLVDQAEGIWTLHELRDDWPGYQVHSTGGYGKAGEPISLPEPFGFAIPTDQWPSYAEGEE